VPAVAAASFPALLYSAQGWIRRRSIDLISASTLFTFAVGLLLAMLVHDRHILLVHSSWVDGAFGIVCLLSLATSHPMAYYVYRWAVALSPEQLARLGAGWSVPYVRFVRRSTTFVWGVAFTAEAAMISFLAYHVSVGQLLFIHPLLHWTTLVCAFGGAILCARHAEPRIESGLRQAAEEDTA
jgi:hypothetical protein